MRGDEAAAELRLAGRICRDLFPRGRLGAFLLALAHDVDAGRLTAEQARAYGAEMVRAVARSAG